MKKLCTWLILFLILFAFPVWATITATYEPNPYFHFEKGFSPLNTNRLVAHVGTLTFNTGGDDFFDPNIIHVNLSTQFGFTGPMVWPNSGPEIRESFFYPLRGLHDKKQDPGHPDLGG